MQFLGTSEIEGLKNELRKGADLAFITKVKAQRWVTQTIRLYSQTI